jgi:hypothetical protein
MLTRWSETTRRYRRRSRSAGSRRRRYEASRGLIRSNAGSRRAQVFEVQALTKSAVALFTRAYVIKLLQSLEYAAASVNKGPLPPAALKRLADLQAAFTSQRQ